MNTVMITSAIVFVSFICAVAIFNVVAWRRAQLQSQAAVLVRIERSTR